MNWLIVFPESWISYSPSCLNFCEMLTKNNQEYLLIYLENSDYNNNKTNINYKAYKINFFLERVLRKLKILPIYKAIKLYFIVRNLLKYKKFDKFVGFDDSGFLPVYLHNHQSIYYSLEISNSILNKIIFKFFNVSLLIIQSLERKNYLCHFFDNNRVVFLQNSPIIAILKQKGTCSYRGKLIYFGHLIKSHGVEFCIKALYNLSSETLVVKGILTASNSRYVEAIQDKYKDLIESGRLSFDFSYIKQENILDYFKNFSIGFCFYDFSLIKTNNYNYLSSPSGKIFNYLFAGLPIIGNNIIGLNLVSETSAGILLNEISEENISNAILKIAENYDYFSKNAELTAVQYSYNFMFDNNKKKIINE